ncbi:MAG: carotenoid 1,2-hydratase [Gammaproteobacteria bacterium]|nr:carotenoid 1,2-hydratase [Gammaproteobacteria bacterium]
MPPGGYAWWYVDATSDDGRYSLVLIFFIGNVFSPYYAFARRRGQPDAEQYCAVNAVLYGPGKVLGSKRWALTERGQRALDRSATRLTIGPSALHWDGATLTADIDEVSVPLPTRLRGQVRLTPSFCLGDEYVLDGDARHRWWPVAPHARVDMEFDQPELAWSGHGYFDHNAGERGLEDDFADWDWSRATLKDGVAILYDVRGRHKPANSLALRVGTDGTVAHFEAPAARVLDTTSIWRIARATRCETGGAQVIKTFEDTPFYARSAVRADLCGEPVVAMHESLQLARFRTRWVRSLLPWRMPRKPW